MGCKGDNWGGEADSWADGVATGVDDHVEGRRRGWKVVWGWGCKPTIREREFGEIKGWWHSNN